MHLLLDVVLINVHVFKGFEASEKHRQIQPTQKHYTMSMPRHMCTHTYIHSQLIKSENTNSMRKFLGEEQRKKEQCEKKIPAGEKKKKTQTTV